MIERIEKKMVEVESCIFVAADGREFSNKSKCCAYEKMLLEDKARKIVGSLPHFVFTPEWTDPDEEWDWFLVSNQMELEAVRTILYNSDAEAHSYVTAKYPCWLACSTEAEGYGCIEGTPEQVFQNIDAFKQGVLEEMRKAENQIHERNSEKKPGGDSDEAGEQKPW